MKVREIELGQLPIEIIDGDRGKNYPHKDELLQRGYCLFLSANNVTKNGFDFSVNQFITKEKDEVLKNGKLNINDIIITTRGTLGNVALYSCKVPFKNIRINSGMLIIRCDERKVDSKFLYYVLSSEIFYKKILALQSGTAQPQLPKSHFIKMKIPYVESLTTQRQIAKILSSLDDKIELNNRINKNLEEQAMAIYEEMIVKLVNNKNGKIGDYCSVKSGFAFKSSWWTDSGVKVIKIKTIDNNTVNFKDCSYVGDDKIQFAEEFIAKEGDVLIAMTGATIGKIALVPKVKEILLVNQRVGKFMLGNNPLDNLPFLYCTLEKDDIINEIIKKGQGSAQPNISPNDIMNTLCYIPNDKVIKNFNKVCKPLFEIITKNRFENEQLTQLRDTLLPKLMNGEIDVSKLNFKDIK